MRSWARDNLPPASAVIDIGCGSGVPVAQALVEGGFELFGVDASPSLLASFRKRFTAAQSACEAAQDSAFFARTFDAAVSIGLLFLLSEEDQATVLPRVAHALRPGGRSPFESAPLKPDRPGKLFVLGFVTNGVYAAALLISIAVGWPIIGLIAGYLMGEGTAWRRIALKRRIFAILTLCWAGMFLLRLAVQVPLYLSGNVEWLAATKLLMGIPLYAPLLILTWLAVRALYRKLPAAS